MAVDAQRVQALVQTARERNSDALIIQQGGKRVATWRSKDGRRPIQTMSITKTVLSLVAGQLIHDGKLALDHPAHRYFPTWRSGPHASITVGQLLRHTSGIDPGKSTASIYRSKDFVAHALSSRVVQKPGTRFTYNNRGYNLVAALLAKAGGSRADRLVAKRLFGPLGIRRFTWSVDRSGNPHGLAGLHMLPADLLKLGQLMLNRGRQDGVQLLSEQWIDLATSPATVQPPTKRIGLMWWLLPEFHRMTITQAIVDKWSAAGVDDTFIEAARPLIGKPFENHETLVTALMKAFPNDTDLKTWDATTWKAGLPDVEHTFGKIVGYYAAGTLGQYLVVVPRHRLVAVRMRRSPKRWADRKIKAHAFKSFPREVFDLVGTVPLSDSITTK